MTSLDYALFPPLDPDHDVVVGVPGPRSVRQLLCEADALSQKLRSGPETSPIVACRDHYHVLVAMLAIWGSGRVAVLPQSLEVSALERLADELSPALLLHDGLSPNGLDLRATEARAARVNDARIPRVPAERVLLSLHTSGTTERPRLVPKSAAQVLGEASMQAHELAISAEDVVLSAAAWHHIYGLLFGVLVPLLSGARLVRDRPSARALASAVRDARASVLVGVPAHLAALAREQIEPGALRLVLSSGAVLADSVAAKIEQLSGAEVIDLLGTTETGGIGYRRAAHEQRWRPLPGVRLEADADERLLLWSPFLPTGMEPYQTADRIEQWPDGSFEYRGRSDRVVKVGGNRVDLKAVEQVARSAPGVRDAAALAIPVAGVREVLLALAVEGDEVDLEALERDLRSKLDAPARPRVTVKLHDLPRDERGKVSVRALGKLLAARWPVPGQRQSLEPNALCAGK